MKRYILLVSLAAMLLNIQTVAAQSPCRVEATTQTGQRQLSVGCEPVGAQTITLVGETLSGQSGAPTVTVSGGARQEFYDPNYGQVYDTYSGRTCQGLPPRLDFHFSRKVSNVTIFMAAETEIGGTLDVTIADNKGRSYVRTMLLGGGVSFPVGFSGGDINHITITTSAPSWNWQVGGVHYDDRALCPGNPSPSPTPTRSRTDDTAVSKLHVELLPPRDSLFFAHLPENALQTTTFRSGGPIRLILPVRRVIGEVNADHTLKDVQQLIDNRVVFNKTDLFLWSYDVDYAAGERDRILFNGVDIGPSHTPVYLNGQDKGWSENRFEIPVELVRFGKRVPGGDPEPGLNEIEIFVDETNNSGQDKWATSIGSASLQVDGLYPVVMVHGNNSCGNFFAGDYRTNCQGNAPTQVMADSEWFIKPFKDQKIPFDNSITMPTDSVDNHANWLLNGSPAKAVRSIKSIADEWGVKHIHVIAHSKGGIDMRKLLTVIPSGEAPGELAVLTFTTLSSPHAGSVGADYAVDAKKMTWLDISRHPEFKLKFRAGLAKFVGSDPGHLDVRVSALRDFNFKDKNIEHLPTYFTVDGEVTHVNYYGIGAEGNLDDSFNSGQPTVEVSNSDGNDETRGLPVINLPSWLPGAVLNGTRDFTYTQIYRLFWGVRETKLLPAITPNGLFTYQRVIETPNDTGQVNDFAVTFNSATYQPLFSRFGNRGRVAPALKKNHATLSSPATADLVISFIHDSQPLGPN